MSEDLKLQLAVLLKNTITMVTFAILAIIFNKWWIVFFSMLFTTITKKIDNKE